SSRGPAGCRRRSRQARPRRRERSARWSAASRRRRRDGSAWDSSCAAGDDQNVIGSRNSRLTSPRTVHALLLLCAGKATATVPRTSRFDPRSAKPPLVTKLTSRTPSEEPGAARPTANELKPSSVPPRLAGSLGSAGHGTDVDTPGWTQLLGTWTTHGVSSASR